MYPDVLQPNENFRGMTYGNWASIWNNWLLSTDPDTYDGGPMLFLRGNVDYRPVDTAEGSPRFIDPKGLLNMTGNKGHSIFEGTSIFIPVITATMTIGHRYEGRILKTQEEIRFAVNLDIDEGKDMWATILRYDDKSSSKIVVDIKNFRLESSMFKLNVPEDSFLAYRTEDPYKPGIYDAITAGYFLIIKSLPPSTYRILFGGKGRGIYFTNSVYDVTVEGHRRDHVVDTSNNMINFKYPE